MKKNIKEMKLRVGGITCAGCVEDMKKILTDTEGVIDAKVNYAEETVHIKYNPEIIDRKKVYLRVRKLVNSSTIISES